MTLLDLQVLETEAEAWGREAEEAAGAGSILDPNSGISILICH
ncbi:SapB/AmfS family lanthipeptide [Streptomyces huiliensis]|nr:SapB/AmfS family lanthipeptide [Streptomyces huiliensis]MBZ4318424.1 SapB/AmfS family lanthipeptide [Streptomyces huiliensis]